MIRRTLMLAHRVHTNNKSSEDKEMDAFLNEVYKKKVSDAIKQRNQEKKLQAQDLNLVTQPCNSAISETSATNILESSNSDNNEIISQDEAGKIHKKMGMDYKK